MAEANATRNRRLLELLFPVREDGDVSLMCFLFVALQMVF